MPLRPYALIPECPHAMVPIRPDALTPLCPYALTPLCPYALGPLWANALMPLRPYAIMPLWPSRPSLALWPPEEVVRLSLICCFYVAGLCLLYAGARCRLLYADLSFSVLML